MEKVFRTDISEKKEFIIYGDTLRMKECVDKEKRIYIFERLMNENNKERLIAFEVVKGKKHKNPDGSIVYTYPSSEQFGYYGFTVFPNHKKSMQEAIEILRNLK